MVAVRLAMMITVVLMLVQCGTPALQTGAAPAMTTPASAGAGGTPTSTPAPAPGVQGEAPAAATLPQNTAEAMRPSTGDGPMPPQTLPEWIKGANIIVQGTVVRVLKEGYTAGFDPQTGAALWRTVQSRQATTPSGPIPTPAPLFPATNFEIKPDTVYRDDGTLGAGKPLIVSVVGRLNSPDTDQSAMPQIGQKYLFVLNQNPDKATYSSSRVCGLLAITADRLQCPGQGSHLLPFMQGVTPSEFLSQLRSAASTPAASSPTSQESAIRAMQLVTPSTGWALTDKRILWTTKAGHAWTALQLPQHVLPATVRSAFFLDDRQGWLALTRVPANGAGPLTLAVLRTSDGGNSWAESTLPPTQPDESIPPRGDVFIDFVDPQHGWVMVRLESGSAFSRGALFRTQDGGASWTKVSAPSGEAVRFITTVDGWTSNPTRGKLYVTHDGGQQWQVQMLPVPPAYASSIPTYDLPTFPTPRDGVLPVTLAGDHAAVVFYATHDGGQSWMVQATMPASTSLDRGGKIKTAVPDPNTWLVALPNGKVHQTQDRGKHWTELHTNGFLDGINELEFATPSVGWARTSSSTCAQFKAQCSTKTMLLATSNDGQSWTPLLSLAGPH